MFHFWWMHKQSSLWGNSGWRWGELDQYFLTFWRSGSAIFLCLSFLGGYLFDHHLRTIFQSSLHILQITFFHMWDLCGQLFLYCIYTCLSDLWVLFMPVLLFQCVNYLFSLENYHPCQDFNPGSIEYQADALPIELSRLGCRRALTNIIEVKS